MNSYTYKFFRLWDIASNKEEKEKLLAKYYGCIDNIYLVNYLLMNLDNYHKGK
jgi:hypothetical protein